MLITGSRRNAWRLGGTIVALALATVPFLSGPVPVQAVPLGASASNGNQQTGMVRTTLPNPLEVTVTGATGPEAGATVTWIITGEPTDASGASLSNTTTTTDANGRASTNMT